MPPLKAPGEGPLPLPSFDGSWKSWALLGSQLQRFYPYLNLQWPSPLRYFSVFSLLLLTVLVIGCRTHPNQLWPHLVNQICKDISSKWGHTLRFRVIGIWGGHFFNPPQWPYQVAFPPAVLREGGGLKNQEESYHQDLTVLEPGPQSSCLQNWDKIRFLC